jgi:hypothetical protein
VVAVADALEVLLTALDGLMAQVAAKRLEVDAQMEDQAEEKYRQVRKVVYALFEGREADFGLKPRKEPAPRPVPARLEGLRIKELALDRVLLTWDSVPETQYYKLYSSADMVFDESDLVETSTRCEKEVPAPPKETRYYSVKAVNAAGESEFSPSISRTTY